MKNEQNNKELESLTKRIHFKSLPFDEKQMFDRLAESNDLSSFLMPIEEIPPGNIYL